MHKSGVRGYLQNNYGFSGCSYRNITFFINSMRKQDRYCFENGIIISHLYRSIYYFLCSYYLISFSTLFSTSRILWQWYCWKVWRVWLRRIYQRLRRTMLFSSRSHRSSLSIKTKILGCMQVCYYYIVLYYKIFLNLE